jgi:hypothetical protein
MTGIKLDPELDRDALDDNDQGLVTKIAADRPAEQFQRILTPDAARNLFDCAGFHDVT